MWGYRQDDEEKVSTRELGQDIERAVDNALRHLPYIESALDEAARVASAMRRGQSTQQLVDEGRGFLSGTDRLDSLLAEANELALNLRRAGTVALHNAYD